MKLPGRYKGSRGRREGPIAAECPCGWRSKPSNPKKAEKRFAVHVASMHGSEKQPRQNNLTLRTFVCSRCLRCSRCQRSRKIIRQRFLAARSPTINSQSFTSGGGIVLPAANQLMMFLVSGPPGQTLSSIADTYGLGGSCSGTPPVCGSWKQFQHSGLHSNSNQGFSNALMTGYYAPTGTVFFWTFGLGRWYSSPADRTRFTARFLS